MLSVLIRCTAEDPVEHLGATLGALVPGVVHGLVGDAVVIAPGGDEGARHVAEAAGAIFLADPGGERGWADAARLARGRYVLLLASGDRPESGWTLDLERALMPPPAGALLLRRRKAGWLGDLSRRFALMRRPSRAMPGLVMERTALVTQHIPPAARLDLVIDAMA